MKTARTIQLKQLAWAVLIGFCVASGGAYAAPGGGSGAGGGSGSGSGGGSGSGSGSGGESPDLGDIFGLYRDADGLPILTADSCQQPLAAPGVTLPAVGTLPECVPASATESCVIPVDPATCGVVVGYETYTQEIDFGRTSVARSPATVLDQALEEAVIRLSTADCITRDAAGRLVTSTVTDGVAASSAIDSPVMNLAMYKQLMLKGYLGAETAPLALPADALDIAAAGLGTAADKTGKVTLDMVVYLNQILGLTDETVTTSQPKKCIEVKEEVMGAMQMVRKCFLDYGPTGGNFAYNRGATFVALPAPAFIPAAAPELGWTEYLGLLSELDPVLMQPTFVRVQGPTLAAVPELVADPAWMGSNIGGFTVAADDARAVINYLHSWPLPEGYATQQTCTASGDTHYDVSISGDSGLQVPVRMVAGTEGREFTLAVANAGPEAATGTVLLTAVDAKGVSILTFPRSYSFTLAPGTSQSWTGAFSISYKTTVTWTATATAEDDVNSANNSVTETTTVIGKGKKTVIGKGKKR